jgi:uncharacterized delta-60 repeat protein
MEPVKRADIARAVPIAALVALTAVIALLPGHPAEAYQRAPLNALARPGDLDRTFGVNGKVVTDFGGLEAVEDLAVQSDGKIVAVGTTFNPDTQDAQVLVARYRRDGSLDRSFGLGGKVTTRFGGTASDGNAVVLQGDGKIVVAGATGGGPTGADIALARYNADGSLDTSFGTGGTVVTDFYGTHEAALAIAVQPDGRLVVAGFTRRFGPWDTNPPDFALARYTSEGRLDTSFDGDGKVVTAFTPGWSDLAYDVALDPSGKIVTAGWAAPDGVSGPGVVDIARYDADGSLDTTFHGDGKVVSAPTGDNGGFGVVVQPDGKVVIAGFAFGAGAQLALLRYTGGGDLDSTFGSGGLATAPLGLGANDLVRQRDGKLVAAGTEAPPSGEPNRSKFAVARFEKTGTPDRAFHGGAVSTDLGDWDEARSLALQADGKIVVGGFSGELREGGPILSQDFALARYVGTVLPCKVPNVRGRTLGVARSLIRRAQCRVGKVKRSASTRVARGRVISQRPAAGATLPNGSRIDLLVSRGRR